ncbi:MAG TPA: O-methyltransferase [Methylovirgula sp.]
MGEALWVDVDRYLDDVLVKQDAVLKAALTSSDAAELPAISVSPNQGKLLHIIARSISARAILEIGTLGGYSTIWLARALPADGKLITLEANEKHAAVARANLAQAGLSERVDVRVGRALESLPKIAADGDGPFDLVFIDADKQTNPDYFEWALTLSRPGTLILVDNVVRDGKLIEASSRDPDILGVRRLLNAMANDRRVVASAMQTVGVKGYDGFAMALVVET